MQRILSAARDLPALHSEAETLKKSLQMTTTLVQNLGQQLQQQGPDKTLANAAVFLSFLGHVVVGGMWLWQAVTALEKQQQDPANAAFYQGKLHACRYFYRWEMPQLQHWNQLLLSADDTCYSMQPEFF